MKYLSELRGQPIALKILQSYLQGSVPPLLIFHGPDGVGKWSAAEAFVKQRLCRVGTACGSCDSCRKFEKNDHPDYICFPAERIAIGEPENPAEFTVRWLLQTRVRYSPFDGPIRFVLFPVADLIQNEAETALLKTLEEPPEHTRFIFLVRSLDDLKPTIVSRGVAIPFQLLPRQDLQLLLGVDGKLHEAVSAGMADGSGGDGARGRSEWLDLLGGSTHYYPLLQSPFYEELHSRIHEAIQHPLQLLALEKWILSGERKAFSDLVPSDVDPFPFEELMDFFSLALLRITRDHPGAKAVSKAIFEFKEELHREQPGMFPYYASRFFHGLMQGLHLSSVGARDLHSP